MFYFKKNFEKYFINKIGKDNKKNFTVFLLKNYSDDQ